MNGDPLADIKVSEDHSCNRAVLKAGKLERLGRWDATEGHYKEAI